MIIVAKVISIKYQARIEEIMKNLEMEDSVTAAEDSFKARFLALELDGLGEESSLKETRSSYQDIQ